MMTIITKRLAPAFSPLRLREAVRDGATEKNSRVARIRQFVPSTSCAVFVAASALLISPGAIAQAATASPYGPDDRLGAINVLTPQSVTDASRLIRTGRVYSLAVEVRPREPGWEASYSTLMQPAGTLAVPHANTEAGQHKSLAFADTIVLGLGFPGTGMDGLAHVARNGVFYNGVRADEIYSYDGARVFSMDTVPPIVGRGVLLDFPRLRGMDSLPAESSIGRAEIDSALRAQRVQLRTGDVVLLHTGWIKVRRGEPTRYNAGAFPGLNEEGARYLASKGAVAVGSDAPTVETVPSKAGHGPWPVHEVLLADNGVYVLEGLDTSGLAADRAYEFMIVVAAPRLAGTTQAVVHPIAIR